MPDGPPPFPVGQRPDAGKIADWVEVAALSRRTAFKRGDLRSAISMENLADPEDAEESTWAELRQRSEIFGARWPLRMVGSRVTRRTPSPVDLTLYRFLVLCGLGGLDDEDRRLFELVVTEVVKALTGQDALHVGHPASDGNDPSFRKRIEQYAVISGLLPGEIVGPPLPEDRDLGLDVVSWLSFEDGRGGGLHFLAQCATGSDWPEKLNDIDVKVWSYHINWCVDPVRVFAVPFALSLPEPKWIRLSAEAGLVLDRSRLVELVSRRALPTALTARLRGRVSVLSAA